MKKGDKVRVIGDTGGYHCFNIGDVLKIIAVRSEGAWHCRRSLFGTRQMVLERDLELIVRRRIIGIKIELIYEKER